MKQSFIVGLMIILSVLTLTSVTGIFGDTDQDGIPEIELDNGRNTDNCLWMFNPDQRDLDQDGIGDACDQEPDQPEPEQPDADRDGVNDDGDNCPLVPNQDQRDTDRDDRGDVCDPDDDNDTVPDNNDNCQLVPNQGQENSDDDELGDACDPDDDNDGLPDEQDDCPIGNGPRVAPECRDDGMPNVSVIAPRDGAVLRTDTVEFRFAVSDDRDVRLDCEILSDINGGGIQTIHRLTGIHAILDLFTGFRLNRFTTENVPDGTYRWFAACVDDNRNRGVSEIVEFTVATRDNTAPTVTLNAPADNAVLEEDEAFLFRFTARDDRPGRLQCQFMSDINGNFRPIGNPEAMNQGANAFAPNNVPPGGYMWNVRCTDTAGNTGTAPFKFSFTINPRVPPVDLCANGVQDQGEEGIDCGGPCALACPADQCENGVRDENEQGIDCGDVCANACPVVPPREPPIVVQTSHPEVTLTATRSEGSAPFRVAFSADVKNGNAPFRYVWNLADGTIRETLTNTLEHTYLKPGRYAVSVRVFDAEGDSAWALISIRTHSGVKDGERDLRLGAVVFEGARGGYGIAHSGEPVMAFASITNLGLVPLEDLKMTFASFDFDLYQYTLIPRVGPGETVTKRLLVDVPPGILPGEYSIRLAVTDGNQLTKVTYHPLLIVE